MQSYWLDGGMWDDQMFRISLNFSMGTTLANQQNENLNQ